MVKIASTMFKSGRILLFIVLLNTLLFSGIIDVKKAIVQKGELTLFFSQSFSKNSVKHFTLQNPHREIYDLKNTRLGNKRVPLGLGSNVKIAQNNHTTVRVVIYGAQGYKPIAYQPFFSSKEYHVSLPKKRSNSLPATRYQQKTSSTTVKKKKTRAYAPVVKHSHKSELIVIDAGHGGHDSGAVAGGKREKDLVLQIAKRLEKQLRKRGHPVYMTRKKDRFLKLHQRTKIADKKNAVLFISIHANSVPKKKQHKIEGIETFFLQKTRDAKSQRIAARENKSVLKGTTKLSRSVIVDSVLSGPKIVQSNKLAIDVQRGIITSLRSKYRGVKDGGVRHAPFWVLVGASRPSILIEVGYISHPKERKRLFSSRYQELLVKGIAYGVDNYLNNRKKEIDF